MYKASGEAMMRLAVLSLACDQTRVATIQWQHGGGGVGPTFRWDGMQHSHTHHQLSHRDGGDGAISGNRLPGVDQMVSEIDRWYMTQLASFLDLMDSFTEGDGTLLDNSVVAYIQRVLRRPVSQAKQPADHSRGQLPRLLQAGPIDRLLEWWQL